MIKLVFAKHGQWKWHVSVIPQKWCIWGPKGEQYAPCVHYAHTVHLFYLDNLPDAIVSLRCCLVRCRVAELVPHFTMYALVCPEDCIVHAIPLSIAQRHNVFVLGSSRYLQPQ